jgi:hypothetical protein
MRRSLRQLPRGTGDAPSSLPLVALKCSRRSRVALRHSKRFLGTARKRNVRKRRLARNKSCAFVLARCAAGRAVCGRGVRETRQPLLDARQRHRHQASGLSPYYLLRRAVLCQTPATPAAGDWWARLCHHICTGTSGTTQPSPRPNSSWTRSAWGRLCRRL